MKNFTIIVILLLLPVAALALSDQIGTTAANYLKLGGGVRPASMGNAFVGLADDPSAAYWNPAGLTQLKAMTFSSMYDSFLADMSHSNLTLTLYNPKMNLSGGLSVDYFNAGQIEETTAGQPYGTGRNFAPSFLVVGLPFAQSFSAVSFGFNSKMMVDNIDTTETVGLAADAGLLWQITDIFSAGFCARNFAGSMFQFSKSGTQEVQYPVAANYAVGLGCRLPNLKLDLDYNMPSDDQPSYSFGAEYSFRDMLFGRIGYSTRAEENAGGNLGAGLGLKFGLIRLDYAYVPYGDLGVTQRIGFSLIPEPAKPAAETTAEAQPSAGGGKNAAPAASAEVRATAEARVSAEAQPVAVTPSIEVRASAEAQASVEARVSVEAQASVEAPAVAKTPAKPAAVKKAAVNKKAKVVKKKPARKRRRR